MILLIVPLNDGYIILFRMKTYTMITQVNKKKGTHGIFDILV